MSGHNVSPSNLRALPRTRGSVGRSGLRSWSALTPSASASRGRWVEGKAPLARLEAAERGDIDRGAGGDGLKRQAPLLAQLRSRRLTRSSTGSSAGRVLAIDGTLPAPAGKQERVADGDDVVIGILDGALGCRLDDDPPLSESSSAATSEAVNNRSGFEPRGTVVSRSEGGGRR